MVPSQKSARYFQMKPVVNFPTRGANTLDQIFTNISEYYSPPSSLPPFGLSDHPTVSLSPDSQIDAPSMPKCKTIKTRDKRPSKIAALDRFFLHVPWSNLLSYYQLCEENFRS